MQHESLSASDTWQHRYFEMLDTALIVGGPNLAIQCIVEESRCLLSSHFTHEPSAPAEFPSDISLARLETCPDASVVELHDPSLSEFKRRMLCPLILKGLTSLWPALEKWKLPSFWINLAGHRYLPVEIGRSYTESTWHQDIIQLRDYLHTYVFSPNPPAVAYIAQYNWLPQIPQLAGDFETPELCELLLSDDMDSPISNLWFGMGGSFTPLHFDRFDNFLVQIVGVKRVLLIDPRQSLGSCTSEDNTSSLTEQELASLLETIPHSVVTLKAGDVLYIPKRWWHQVESLSFSISVSFWY